MKGKILMEIRPLQNQWFVRRCCFLSSVRNNHHDVFIVPSKYHEWCWMFLDQKYYQG